MHCDADERKVLPPCFETFKTGDGSSRAARMLTSALLPFTIACVLSLTNSAILYPQDSETREVKSLDGLWWLVLEPSNSVGFGFLQKWWKRDLSQMENATAVPVPSSYNDLGTAREMKDHVGWAWYQKGFYVPVSWKQQSRIVIRFGSVNYYAIVWVNGKLCVTHIGGHLPFEAEISDYLTFDGENVVTVAVNNTLTRTTIPPGEFQYKIRKDMYPKGFFIQTPNFDFFNYAGIQRSVVLYRTPKIYIEDIDVKSEVLNHTNGLVHYAISLAGYEFDPETVNISIMITDRSGRSVAYGSFYEGQLEILDANLWWPQGMNRSVGYLYTFNVEVTIQGKLLDRYRLKIGIRSVQVEKNSFKINGVPFYFKGCGMHEDSDIRGRGFDYGVMVKDLNLLEWLGANSFRTSHYPYSEERMMEADRRGIVVIDETPAVGLFYFTGDNLQLHKQMLSELIDRDKNHPSVVMWSLANEPRSDIGSARAYFRELVDLAHSLDKSRPVTIVYGPTQYDNEKTADLVDVIGINRYYGWYVNIGHLEIVSREVIQDLTMWKQKFHKPILVTEYGADSVAGLNTEPSTGFTESYQVDLMKETHQALDVLASQKVIVGEMFWNFADFMTAQSTIRVNGNRKGVFTRTRQPKMAAYLIRNRYTALSSIVDQRLFIKHTSNNGFL